MISRKVIVLYFIVMFFLKKKKKKKKKRSRLISEAKQGRAWLVLGWETSWNTKSCKLLGFLHYLSKTLAIRVADL